MPKAQKGKTPLETAPAFKDEVLGKRVEILFEQHDGNSSEFYAGTIRAVNIELKKTGALEVTHEVHFDDGDEQWFDLAMELSQGRLKWPVAATTTTAMANDTGKRPSSSNVTSSRHVTPQKKKAKTKSGPTIDVKQESGTKRNEEATIVAGVLHEETDVKLQKKTTRTKSDPIDIKEEQGGKMLHEETDVKLQKKKTRTKSDPIDVKEEQGRKMGEEAEISEDTMDEETGEDMELHLPVPDPMPGSITDIIRFMDELEPGKGYFERQKDSRGECSGTRGKLRRFAKKNPEHPGIKHWVETKKWEPPNAEALYACIDILKKMIK